MTYAKLKSTRDFLTLNTATNRTNDVVTQNGAIGLAPELGLYVGEVNDIGPASNDQNGEPAARYPYLVAVGNYSIETEDGKSLVWTAGTLNSYRVSVSMRCGLIDGSVMPIGATITVADGNGNMAKEFTLTLDNVSPIQYGEYPVDGSLITLVTRYSIMVPQITYTQNITIPVCQFGKHIISINWTSGSNPIVRLDSSDNFSTIHVKPVKNTYTTRFYIIENSEWEKLTFHLNDVSAFVTESHMKSEFVKL